MTTNKPAYEHLTIIIPRDKNEVITETGFENKYKYYIKKALSRSDFFINATQKSLGILKKLIGHLDSYNQIRNDERNLIERINSIKESPENSQRFGSGYGYDDEIREFNVVVEYYNQLKSIEEGKENILSESQILYERSDTSISDIISHDSEVKTFLNFGVGYAHIDSKLALKFPSCKFIGLDRSELTKTFNKNCFSTIQNLSFVAGDVIDYLENNRFNGGIFYTSRILCFLPKSFNQRLYNAVAKAGFKYIVGFEQTGISRQTMKPFEFSENETPSVVYRGLMYIHNYPELIVKAMFRVTKIELIKTNHPHKDIRLIHFVGIREKKLNCCFK